jgi:hypothetical protein
MRGEIMVWRPGSIVPPHELTCVADHGGGG